jgi:hypothetical protein
MIMRRAHNLAGLSVPAPLRNLSARYRAASGILTVEPHGDFESLPDIISLIAPLSDIDRIVAECTEALEPYSRLIGRNPSARGTLSAGLCLPREVLEQPQPGGLIAQTKGPAHVDPSEGRLPTQTGVQLVGTVQYVTETAFASAKVQIPTNESRSASPILVPELHQPGGADAKATLERLALRREVVCLTERGRSGPRRVPRPRHRALPDRHDQHRRHAPSGRHRGGWQLMRREERLNQPVRFPRSPLHFSPSHIMRCNSRTPWLLRKRHAVSDTVRNSALEISYGAPMADERRPRHAL